MKRKKKIKSEIQTAKKIANQVNMNFTQKILNKYGVGKLKNRFSTLILRQYASKAIDPINTKSNKELPVPFNILRITQCNSQNYSTLDSSYRVQEKQQRSSGISIMNKLTIINLFNKIYEKYNKNLFKKVAPDRNVLNGRGKVETKWMDMQQKPIFSKGLNRITQIFSGPMSLLLKPQTEKNQLKTLEAQDQFRNTQNFSSFIRAQRQSIDLLYDKSRESELKTSTLKSLGNRNINENTNGKANGNTNGKANGNTNGKAKGNDNGKANGYINGKANGYINGNINRYTNGITNGYINGNTNEITDGITSEITNILIKNVMNNRSPQISFGESAKVDTVLQNEESSEIEKENIQHGEMILHTSVTKSETKKGFTPKTHGFLKSALIQADGAISRILKNLYKKQKTSDFDNGFSTKNIYQSRLELVPATKKKEIKKQKHEDGNLILCKPDIKETVVGTEQTSNDVLPSDKEVYAKAVTSSRLHKSINEIDTEEVNLLAERILKILEKKLVIQKERRGLR